MRRFGGPLSAVVVGLLLAACSSSSSGSGVGRAPAYAADRECISGLQFAASYHAVSARFDPQLETDRQALAASASPESSKRVLGQLADLLGSYDDAIAGLHPPSGYSDSLGAVLAANQQLGLEARRLSAGPTSAEDQSAFQAVVDARHAAVRNLDLQLGFLASECQ